MIDRRFEVGGKWYKLVVTQDECPQDPREYAQAKMCVREHRKYAFPNELNFDFDLMTCLEPSEIGEKGQVTKTYGDEEMERLNPYHVFWLDCYEHSGISFSFSGEGNQCRFDTAKAAGFIAVEKFQCPTREQAAEVARGELDNYNKYLSGEAYVASIYEIFPLFRENGTPSEVYETELYEDYFVDDISDIPDFVPEGFKEAVANAIASY